MKTRLLLAPAEAAAMAFVLKGRLRRLPSAMCCCFFISIIGLGTGFGQGMAQLRPAESIQDGDHALCPGPAGSGYAIPAVTDWNGDGKKDLLIGYQPAGKIALYLNAGSSAHPCFTNFANLKAENVDICHPSSGCGAPAPWVGDFDADGDRDLLVGAGSDGTVWLYRNTNTDSIPFLAPGVQLRAGTSVLSVGQRAAPCYGDWDGDGLKDLLCGAGDGYVYFFRNTNSAAVPMFAAAVKLRAGGKDLNIGIRSVVRVFDWDQDGNADLVCSSDSGVYWCPHTGPDALPVLDSPQPLCAPMSGRGLIPINTGGRMRIEVVDWNDDGTVDLLVGNLNGTLSFFEGYAFRATALTPKPSGFVILQWNSSPFLAYDILAGASPLSITETVVTNVPSSGKTTSWEIPRSNEQQFFRVRMVQ